MDGMQYTIKTERHLLLPGVKVKRMKKRIMKTMLMLIMSAMCFLTQTTSSLAYKESEYEINQELGIFYLNNADGPNKVPVTMFLLVQDDYVDAEFHAYYNIWCDEGTFIYNDGYESTMGELEFTIRSQNANRYYYRTVEGLGEIWMMQFTIEPGTYVFSLPNGANYITILPSTLSSPLFDDGYTESEHRVVSEDEEVQLYGLLGDDDWRKESAPLEYIMDFARSMEDSLVPQGSKAEETTDTVQVENDSVKPDEEAEEVESALAEAETIESPSDEELQVSEETEAPKEKSGALKFVVTGIVLIAITVLLFVIKKKDEESSNKE